MQELSIFLDESGSDGLKDRYYLLTLVTHNQEIDITNSIQMYEGSLRRRNLPNIAFHASPLLNGHHKYDGYSLATRKQLLASFRVFLRNTPFRYHCISIKVTKDSTIDAISSKMRQGLVDFIFEQLPLFQIFDCVKIYYDNGKKSIADAVHKAMDYALSKNVVTYRLASPEDYRLSQVADYVCTMELTARKYEDGVSTATDEKFFGSYRQFKKGILKELRAKKF